MSALRSIVARNLRLLRSARGLAQEEVAGRAGIDRSYLSSVENERYSASLDKIEAIAAALEIAPWQLLHPDTVADPKE